LPLRIFTQGLGLGLGEDRHDWPGEAAAGKHSRNPPFAGGMSAHHFGAQGEIPRNLHVKAQKLGYLEPGFRSHVLDWKVHATPTEVGGYRFDGIKHFSSGAKGSDLLLVFGVVQDDSDQKGAIITAVIPTDRAGVVINDDWQALGMRRTDSGTTEFHDVEVRPDEVLGGPNAVLSALFQFQRGSLFGPLVQLVFVNVYLCIARGALDAAAEYTRTQARPWTPAGVTQAVEDPYVIRTYGEFGIALQGADAAAREAAGPCPHVVDTGFVVMRLRAA